MVSPWQPGQLLWVGFHGTVAPPELLQTIGQGRIGGVILFTRNLQDPPKVAQLVQLVQSLHDAASPEAPIMVAIDQEGGRVQRLREPWTVWPPMRELGLAGDPSLTQRVAAAIGRELSDLGITLDFAPVVDVDTNPANPIIGDRSFGAAPKPVIEHARAFIEGLQGARVGACAKHFPGHGDTLQDSHHELPRLPHDLDRLREIELPPFAAAAAAGVAAMMTAHVVFEALDKRRPATLSPDVMHLLREEIAYDGVVFSDDLEMKAIADHYRPEQMVDGALTAGVDALLVCSQFGLALEVLKWLERMPDAKVERSIARVLELHRRFAPPPLDQRTAPPYAEHRELAKSIARR